MANEPTHASDDDLDEITDDTFPDWEPDDLVDAEDDGSPNP